MIRHILVAAALAAFAVPALSADFKLTSSDIGPDKPLAEEFVYNGFQCKGGNQSFALAWSGAPAGTKSFAVTFFDPGAMNGRGFWHWLVVDIPASVTSLPRDAGNADNSKLPSGARQLRMGFGKTAYGGSCPPAGDKPHDYVVTVHAIKVPKLDLPAEATAAQALPVIEANSLGKASIGYAFGR